MLSLVLMVQCLIYKVSGYVRIEQCAVQTPQRFYLPEELCVFLTKINELADA